MANKVAILCLIGFLILSFTRTYAARPEPAFTDETPMETQFRDVEVDRDQVEDSCEGVDEEECLMRRTLAAHIDYIYTQKHKP